MNTEVVDINDMNVFNHQHALGTPCYASNECVHVFFYLLLIKGGLLLLAIVLMTSQR